jgi:hypothetical protein
LLHSGDEELLLDHRKQNGLEESEELEPRPKERTVTVLELTGGAGTTETDIKVSEETDWNEQPAATGQGIVRLFAC